MCTMTPNRVAYFAALYTRVRALVGSVDALVPHVVPTKNILKHVAIQTRDRLAYHSIGPSIFNLLNIGQYMNFH